MKYIIELPDDFAEATKEYWDKTVGLQLEPYIEPDRKAIEDEVWKLARTIESMSVGEIMNIFDVREENVPFLCNTRTYQEAKSKFEAWMNQKDEIFNTGDEVWDDELKSRGVVLRIYNSGNIDILWDDGSAGECIYHKKIHKTGRHFPEVIELLQKMRGEEQ